MDSSAAINSTQQPGAQPSMDSSSSSRSASPDPHVGAAELAGPDATSQPMDEEALADEERREDEETQHQHLVLPRVFLVRHGQSLFNAMYAAHAQLPDKRQTRLNFGAAASSKSGGSGGSSSSSYPPGSAAQPIEEGSLVGGLPLIRDRIPNSDPRLLDAPLTLHGQQQARDASVKARQLGPIDLVLSTPLTRAIQTSLLVFRPRNNNVDWKTATTPSLDQPLTPNVSLGPPVTPVTEADVIPIRILPHHVEHLVCSCDVGVPISVLESRFSNEPAIDFEEIKRIASDCWWTGASVGSNIGHLNIKRTAGTAMAASASASAGATVPASAAAAASSAAAAAPAASRPSSAPRVSISLKPSASFPASGLHIVREQSESIERRTRKLLHYLLSLAVSHATAATSDQHRPLHVALVGHCGFFGRLSGHTLDNCEIVALDWGFVLKRQAIKGALSMPPGMTQSDVGDPRKQGRIIQHWMEELGDDRARLAKNKGQQKKGAAAGAGGAGGPHYTASNPPTSSNTKDLLPVPLRM